MRACVWRAGFAIALCALPAGAVAAGPVAQLAQNDSNAGPAAAAPAALPANLPEQIKKAQVELKRLECLKGRIDGKLGEQTRQAVKKFWASAKQPEGEVAITDELIASLAERGDLFCRPPRRFFALGGRPGALPFAPGARQAPVPPAPARPPVPAAPE
jgi:peptidoglycan hydrolase-like protein with peptidoglycan-binding domain